MKTNFTNELSSISALIEKTFPIPGKFRGALPSDIAELSRRLTDSRGDRSLSYMNRPNYLTAYLRYFLPWNLFRLSLLLPNLEIKLSPNNIIVDLGSGPLTFVLALWLARPELRDLSLEFYCIDRSSTALYAGKKLFLALAGEKSPWKINAVREDIDFRHKRSGLSLKEPASMLCAVNLFNEVYENIPHSNANALKNMAETIAGQMHGQAAPESCILTVEPGIPQSGRFISFLRDAFLELGRPPVSPCTHSQDCPAYGGKKRWCHFAFDTEGAPEELLQLSKAAGLPKERIAFSYLQTGVSRGISRGISHGINHGFSLIHTDLHGLGLGGGTVRVISDSFALPGGKFGRYGCCAQGLVLLTGNKRRIDKIASGDLVPVTDFKEQRDAKSGALIMETAD